MIHLKLKGYVHPTIKILSSFIHYPNDFLLGNANGKMLKNSLFSCNCNEFLCFKKLSLILSQNEILI